MSQQLKHIEVDFPVEQVNPLARREANAKRPIYMLHKWWARRLGCVFRTIILSSLIPDEEWQKLEETAQKQGKTAWDWLYYRRCHLGKDEDHTGHGCGPELIERYCKDKVILDPFMGGGTTVVEALRLGCKVIGLDVNPVAWFITKKSVEPVDIRKLEDAFKRMDEEVAPEILRWYRTRCPKGHEADVMYVFWVRTVRCSSCGKKTRLFNSFRIATKDGRDAVVCPKCYTVDWVPEGSREVTCRACGHSFNPYQGFAKGGKFTCEHCGTPDETVEWVRRTGQPPGYEMFAVEYWCEECYGEALRQGYPKRQAQQMARGYKGADGFDRELYEKACEEFERVKDSLPLPEGDIPVEGRSDPRPISFGMRRWQDLFNPRQLLCLGKLMQAVLQIEDKAVRELMAVTVSDTIRANNMLCVYTAFRQTIEPLFSLHAYWPSDLAVENNVWGTYLGRGSFKSGFNKTMRGLKWLITPEELTRDGKEVLHDSPLTGTNQNITSALDGVNRCALLARTAEDLSFLPDQCVDVVITDPPYYGNV
ncbi:MAG: hypothetical protein DRP95_04250, partial [Candidatus Latescibacterota bacterium]